MFNEHISLRTVPARVEIEGGIESPTVQIVKSGTVLVRFASCRWLKNPESSASRSVLWASPWWIDRDELHRLGVIYNLLNPRVYDEKVDFAELATKYLQLPKTGLNKADLAITTKLKDDVKVFIGTTKRLKDFDSPGEGAVSNNGMRWRLERQINQMYIPGIAIRMNNSSVPKLTMDGDRLFLERSFLFL